MEDFQATVLEVLNNISDIVWSQYVLIPLLFITGLVLTIRLGGLQFRLLWRALSLAFLKRKDDTDAGDISQFQALTTAMAATVGVGNIVGVATAIAIGGPGALFWMWVTGLVGMASKYAEAFLGVRFRTTDTAGEKSGGPQYYLQRGIKGGLGKFLAITFAIFAFIASFGIGNLTQGNAISANLEESFNIAPWITGLVVAVITLIVLVGGIKSIGRVTAGLVPIMIVFYIAGALWVIGANLDALPGALAQIFTDAFTGTSAVGGFTGAAFIIAVQMGFARGIFSNESGMGSAAIAAAAAKTTHPVRQGLVSMTQTFIDTIIVVTCTGLVLVVTGQWTVGERGDAAVMTARAFNQGLPGDWGHYVVTIGIVLFAYSTMLGWSYYGERNVERLFGRALVMPYRIVFAIVVYFGATVALDLAWVFSDIANGLMAIPNLVGLLILSGLIARETKHYLKNDPKLEADAAEVEAFMAGQPGWEEWKSTSTSTFVDLPVADETSTGGSRPAQ